MSKKRRNALLIALFLGFLLLGACGATEAPKPSPASPTPATSIPPTPTTVPATFTLTPATATPTLPQGVDLIDPGEKVGEMILSIAQPEGETAIWESCDPFGTVLECQVPAVPRLHIGQGFWERTTEELDALWESTTAELFLDGQPINLPAFGTSDLDVDIDGPAKLRLWNVLLEQSTPGKHTLRWVVHYTDTGELLEELAWTFTVVGKTSYPSLSSTVSPGQHPYTSQSADVNFLLYLPDEYGTDARQQWPLILYLHGRGERGYDLEALKRQPLPEKLEQEADFPFIVVSPQLSPDKDSWSDLIDPLENLLDELQRVLSVDSDRLLLTGISMGGQGTWEYGLRYPERFAALVPIASFYNFDSQEAPDNICDLREVPIWVFHGSSDTTIPPKAAEVLVGALKACGGNVQFTLYPNADHVASWRQAYAYPELYTWLSSQSLR